jgi:hypothetical protein
VKSMIGNKFVSLNTLHGDNEHLHRKNVVVNSSRDTRCFKKNSVRVVGSNNILMSRDMESVLPKESEREIQLRLDADAGLSIGLEFCLDLEIGLGFEVVHRIRV